MLKPTHTDPSSSTNTFFDSGSILTVAGAPICGNISGKEILVKPVLPSDEDSDKSNGTPRALKNRANNERPGDGLRMRICAEVRIDVT